MFVLPAGDREMVQGPDVHPGGSRRHRSFNFTADQRRFILGPHQTGAKLRTGTQREK